MSLCNWPEFLLNSGALSFKYWPIFDMLALPLSATAKIAIRSIATTAPFSGSVADLASALVGTAGVTSAFSSGVLKSLRGTN